LKDNKNYNSNWSNVESINILLKAVEEKLEKLEKGTKKVTKTKGGKTKKEKI